MVGFDDWAGETILIVVGPPAASEEAGAEALDPCSLQEERLACLEACAWRG